MKRQICKIKFLVLILNLIFFTTPVLAHDAIRENLPTLDNSDIRIVSAHLMSEESVGAEIPAKDDYFVARPLDPIGVLATPIQEYMTNLRKPVDAATQDIGFAKRAGINTFNLLLSPHRIIPGSQFSSAIKAYWQVAEKTPDFKMDVDIWGVSMDDQKSVDNMSDNLKFLYNNYGSAWRRHRGRLVVLLQIGKFSSHNNPTEETLNKLFDGMGGRKAIFLVLYNPSDWPKSSAVFKLADAYTDWLETDYAHAIKIANQGEAISRSVGKPYWYPIMPSFMQSRPFGKVTPNVREKLGASNFLADWRRAINAHAEAVNITTWNDMTEDSALMPESNHSYGFYDLNQYYSKWLLTNSQPKIERNQIMLFHHPQPVNWAMSPSRKDPTKVFPWELETPPTDYVMVVSLLKSPADIAVKVGDKTIGTETAGTGESAWLIYSKQKSSNDNICPTEIANIKCVQIGSQIGTGNVSVSISNGGKSLHNFESHVPISENEGRGELTVIGDAFSF